LGNFLGICWFSEFTLNLNIKWHSAKPKILLRVALPNEINFLNITKISSKFLVVNF